MNFYFKIKSIIILVLFSTAPALMDRLETEILQIIFANLDLSSLVIYLNLFIFKITYISSFVLWFVKNGQWSLVAKKIIFGSKHLNKISQNVSFTMVRPSLLKMGFIIRIMNFFCKIILFSKFFISDELLKSINLIYLYNLGLVASNGFWKLLFVEQTFLKRFLLHKFSNI